MPGYSKNDTRDVYINIGKRIAQFRMECNMSQAQLAQILNIRQQVIAGYEIAKRRIPISMLKPIADTLSVKVEDILGLSQKDKPGPTSVIERKLEFIKTLPQKTQKKILTVLDSAIDMTT